MKKSISIFAIICFTVLSYNIIYSQWQPEVRLTNDYADSYTSQNNAWCIATSGSVVHVVWWDYRDGNYEIYYKRSTDGGISWGADTNLTNNTAKSQYPSVLVNEQVVHIVWSDERDGNWEIYYKRSTDGGTSWGVDTRLTNNFAQSDISSASVYTQFVHVVWNDTRDGNYEIYYKYSTDGGTNWGADTRLTNNSAVSFYPSVSVSGSVVHAVWQDNRDGNTEIYYKRSTDGGTSWESDTRLTSNSAYSYSPSVSVSNLVVHVVWYDTRDGNWEIYYKCSTNGGTSWEADIRLTNNSANSWYPSILVSDSIVHVVWYDNRDGNDEIYYMRSTDGGTSWGADTRLTNDAANSRYPCVSVSGQVVHVVWSDERDWNWEIYYKRNPTGNPVGIIKNNSKIPLQYLLFQNYPNPFNPITNIKFDIPKSNHVKIIIYNALGKEVAKLVNEKLSAGSYEVDWNATDYMSGVYFYKLLTDKFVDVKKMILIK